MPYWSKMLLTKAWTSNEEWPSTSTMSAVSKSAYNQPKIERLALSYSSLLWQKPNNDWPNVILLLKQSLWKNIRDLVNLKLSCNTGRQKTRKGGGGASLQRKCSALWQARIAIGGLEDTSSKDNNHRVDVIALMYLTRWSRSSRSGCFWEVGFNLL